MNDSLSNDNSKYENSSKSWEIVDDSTIIKHCDKSIFAYRGATIPRALYSFFGANEIPAGSKRDIHLYYQGTEYSAVLQREKHELARIRIFWHSDLGKEFEIYDNPLMYPDLCFSKNAEDRFSVYFIASSKSAAENEAILPEEITEESEGKPIIEGAKKQITVNSYERDPKAKWICKEYYLKKYGRVVCQICGFDFGKTYGAEYTNKIHVHHIKPVSEIGEQYVLDPINDLIPVCPNCHMVLHTGSGISVEDLKAKLDNITRNK